VFRAEHEVPFASLLEIALSLSFSIYTRGILKRLVCHCREPVQVTPGPSLILLISDDGSKCTRESLVRQALTGDW